MIFCKLSLAFCKRGSSTAWKRKQKAFFGQTWCLMPLSIKCWQLSLSCFPREHILFSHNNISKSFKSYFPDPESANEALLNKVTFCKMIESRYGSGYHMI